MRIPPGGGFKTPKMDRPVKCHSDNPVPSGKIPSDVISEARKTPQKLISDNPLPPNIFKPPDFKLPDVLNPPDFKLPDFKIDIQVPEVVAKAELPEIGALERPPMAKCHMDLPWRADVHAGPRSTDSFEPASGTKLAKKD
jgi:hypothetical protein